MIRQLLRIVLPTPALNIVSGLKRWHRRASWEKRVKNKLETRFTREQLVEQLQFLGLDSSRDVIVHSSLSSLGYVEGGPLTVIEAIREVIGPKANLLMPAYPMRASMLETMRDLAPFDLINDPSFMGKITEVFRHLPNVERSAHPTHSVAVQGPDAKTYVANHHKSRSPCGSGSPFRILSDRGGAVLCLGTGIGKVTSHHTIEDMFDDFPVQVYVPEVYFKDVKLKDGTIVQVEVLVHDPKLAPIRVDNHQGMEKKILDEMRKRGIVREGRIGLAAAYLFGAADLDAMHRDLLREGVTIYAT
jgi:aminoglycoside 3-N-acetyltransferase